MGYNLDEEQIMNVAEEAAQATEKRLTHEEVFHSIHKTLEERIEESGAPLSFGEEID